MNKHNIFRIFLLSLALATAVSSSMLIRRISADEQYDLKENRFSTFSICAIDPSTGEAGAAVTTRVPFVGRAVPWAMVNVGAVATQSWTVVEYGPQGLELMKQGLTPQEALDKMLAEDQGKERRQLGLINMQGDKANFTGNECGPWAGAVTGKNYTAQANIMVGPQVLEAVARVMDETEGTGMPLAERLILALEAGQKEGGDKRWGLLQSAAIVIADPNNPGRRSDNISLSIEVGENPHPVQELKRIYYTTQRRLGYRNFSQVSGDDVIELKIMLNKLGFWRPDLKQFPDAPVFSGDNDLRRTDPQKFTEMVQDYYKKLNEYNANYSIYDEETIAAVDAFRKQNALDYEGNPSGLVDEIFIKSLREQYYSKVKIEKDSIKQD